MSERQLLPAVEKRVVWRRRDDLTQEQAFRVMRRHGFPVGLSTLQKWETGERKPTHIAALVLEAFLNKHPLVTSASGPSNADADE